MGQCTRCGRNAGWLLTVCTNCTRVPYDPFERYQSPEDPPQNDDLSERVRSELRPAEWWGRICPGCKAQDHRWSDSCFHCGRSIGQIRPVVIAAPERPAPKTLERSPSQVRRRPFLQPAPQEARSDSPNWIAVVAIFLVVGALVATLPGHDSTSPSGPSLPAGAQTMNVTSRSSVEAILASIDRQSPRVPVSLVQGYARLLDGLAAKCPDSRDDVGAMAAKSVTLLKERHGIERPVLRMLEEMNRAVPLEPRRTASCSEVAAMIIILTTVAQ
jgi:hypothetical protein